VSTVVLVRHGRTAWHQPNRYTGSSDVPLDEVGEAQATSLAAWAVSRAFRTVACSTLVRARATADPAAAALDVPVVADPRLAELDFGWAEGRTLDEVRAADPGLADRFLTDPVAHHFPDGEAPTAAARRFHAAIADLVAGGSPGPILVIAHSTIIRLHLCDVLGLPLRDYRRRLPVLDPAAATTLRYPASPGEPIALLGYNVPIPPGLAP
jgi:probable phosphoglycerate mutase